ncbi:SOS response-associated peptidase [Erythrobacter sp. W53]|uniref:SOS response-associated peptidase n=1 Tax=Erythrobacter sp. W53 TaxID=3425947 RepID=UPI003D7674F5
MTKNADEVARLFEVQNGLRRSNLGQEVYPGYPGAVIANGALRSMIWGFPLALKSKRTGEPLKPRPVNNARTDKLDSFMWRDSFENRRCLIPLTAWAEAQGIKGKMTRTWLSLPHSKVFAVAGIWRESDEWGPCYSMLMTDAAGDAAKIHNRMPVILEQYLWSDWTGGSPTQIRRLLEPKPWQLSVHPSEERWATQNQLSTR